MKVAINCAFLQPKGGGIKEYIINLVNNISYLEPENDYVIYVLSEFKQYAEKTLNSHNIRIKEIPFSTGSNLKKIVRSLFEHRFWRKEELIEKWDLFHSPFFHSPKLKHTKTIITVHDLRFVRYPETYSFLRAIFLKRVVKRSILNANSIISISEFTKSEIINTYSIESTKIVPILEAIDISKFSILESADKGPANLDNTRFILSVGHLEPRKNYERLIYAFLKMKSSHSELSDVKLVIVGQKGCQYENTLKLIQNHNDIIYLNFVSHEILIWLYQNASLFAFPSIYEGFGFPPLEAAALGLVSAVSNSSSIPEVCGDSVIYFNPYDCDDISNALYTGLTSKEIVTCLKSKLNGLLASFSWEDNARKTLAVYHSLIK